MKSRTPDDFFETSDGRIIEFKDIFDIRGSYFELIAQEIKSDLARHQEQLIIEELGFI